MILGDISESTELPGALRQEDLDCFENDTSSVKGGGCPSLVGGRPDDAGADVFCGDLLEAAISFLNGCVLTGIIDCNSPSFPG